MIIYMNNYTHILSIRLWNNKLQRAIKDNELEEYIKATFIEKEQLYNGIRIIWRKKNLTRLELAFNKGDIVIESPLGCDEILLNATREKFIEMNKYLHETQLLAEDLIATFTIMKPLSRRMPLLDTDNL